MSLKLSTYDYHRAALVRRYTLARRFLLIFSVLSLLTQGLVFMGINFFWGLGTFSAPFYSTLLMSNFLTIGADTGWILLTFLFAFGLPVLYLLCSIHSKRSSGWLLTGTILFGLDTVCTVFLYLLLLPMDAMSAFVLGGLDLGLHIFLFTVFLRGTLADYQLGVMPAYSYKQTPDSFRLEEDVPAPQPKTKRVMPQPKGERTTDWEFDFASLPYWKAREHIPFVFDIFLPCPKKDLLFCVHTVAEVSMLNYKGFFAILENKESPRVVFASQKRIVGPNLYVSGEEEYLCIESFSPEKGAVMLLYSVSRKAFAVLERDSGNPAGAFFSRNEQTVTLVTEDGASLQFSAENLTWLPLEQLDSAEFLQ